MDKLIDFVKKMYKKYEAIILYVFFGGLTTVVDFTVYFSTTRLFGLNEQIATWLAWFCAVLFAFFTNRKWVFKAEHPGFKAFAWQVGSFFASRLFSGFINWLMIFVFVSLMGISDIIIKCAAAVVVIILNYILSKLIVFKKKD